eukprot:UN03254
MFVPVSKRPQKGPFSNFYPSPILLSMASYSSRIDTNFDENRCFC